MSSVENQTYDVEVGGAEPPHQANPNAVQPCGPNGPPEQPMDLGSVVAEAVDEVYNKPPTYTRSEVEDLIGTSIDPEVWEFIPWGHRVVVKRYPKEEMVGSIAIPDDAQEPLAKGWVVRVGNRVGVDTGKFTGECPLFLVDLVGQTVLFGKWAGQPLKSDSKSDPFESEYLVMLEDDLWGHIRKERK